MKLTRLMLKNVRCYRHLDLSFKETDEEGNTYNRNRTVILGNNGTGKSTILKSISLLLAGSSALGEIIGHPNSWIRNKTNSCELTAFLETSIGEEKEIKLEILRDDNLSKIISRNEKSLQQLEEALQYTERNYLNIGYGVHRRIGGKSLHAKTSNYQNTRADNVATLFDPEASLYPFESWIMDLDYRKGAKGLSKVKEALNKLIPESKFYRIDKASRTIKFKNKDGIIDFSQLSDGFQITANWLGDLLYRISSTYEDYKNPLDAKFILLIDEIALHLHPAWQRVILQSISELFKNAQIIATTHSPFVAQQARANELFTIIRTKKGDLDAFHYENDPRKLLIHQIIMSDIFGIPTDESVAVEKAKNDIRTNPSATYEGIIKSKDQLIEKLSSEKIDTLKNVDDLQDIPLNLYTHKSMDYGDIINKLQDEIKKLSDDKPESKY